MRLGLSFVAFALVALIGLIDYVTGPQIALSIFLSDSDWVLRVVRRYEMRSPLPLL